MLLFSHVSNVPEVCFFTHVTLFYRNESATTQTHHSPFVCLPPTTACALTCCESCAHTPPPSDRWRLLRCVSWARSLCHWGDWWKCSSRTRASAGCCAEQRASAMWHTCRRLIARCSHRPAYVCNNHCIFASSPPSPSQLSEKFSFFINRW